MYLYLKDDTEIHMETYKWWVMTTLQIWELWIDIPHQEIHESCHLQGPGFNPQQKWREGRVEDGVEGRTKKGERESEGWSEREKHRKERGREERKLFNKQWPTKLLTQAWVRRLRKIQVKFYRTHSLIQTIIAVIHITACPIS